MFGPSKEVQLKVLYMIYKYTFSLKSATRVSLQAQDTAVLNTDWPVQN